MFTATATAARRVLLTLDARLIPIGTGGSPVVRKVINYLFDD